MKKRILGTIMSVVLIVQVMIVPNSYVQAEVVKPALPALEILEIQPGKSYDIDANMKTAFKRSLDNREINVRQMSMPEFISNSEPVNGKYDIVYVGNNQTDGVKYIADGSPSLDTKFFTDGTTQYIQALKNINGNAANNLRKEYYSGNDITNLAALKIKEFIDSGQLTIFEESIFDNSGTKLYSNFQTSLAGKVNVKTYIRSNNTAPITSFEIDKLVGYYYNNINLKFNPINIRNERSINYDWGNSTPFSNIGNDDFSVRWIGEIKAERTGEYIFNTTADDGVKLYIDNQLVIDKWIDQSATTYTYKKALVKDQTYNIKMEYYEKGGQAVAKLWYTTPENTINNLIDLLKEYQNSTIKKRPILSMVTKPLQYNGLNAIDGVNKMLSFKFDTYNVNNANGKLRVNLYIDKNGDGRFEDKEIAQAYVDTASVNGFTINYMMPENYTGLQPWKLELIDGNNVKTYQTGLTAFKGTATNILVLQIIPGNSNTFRIDSLTSYLEKTNEYKIQVTTKTAKEFNDSFDTNNPMLLNGNYDMLILGFADTYTGGHISNIKAINEIKSFIDSKQSVMFTHDTISVGAFNNSSWGGKDLTFHFRDMLGQNIYVNNHATMDQGKYSLGVSRTTINRVITNSFDTTTRVHKINESLVTQYPYILGENIDVATTHYQYFQLDLEDPDVIPIFTLNGGAYNNADGRNDYYTYTKGTLTYSGTGHSPPSDKFPSELKMFINTIIKASRGANQAPTVTINGLTDKQKIANKTNILNFNITAYDYEDARINAKVYIDKNNNGRYDDPEELVYENLVNQGVGGLERGIATALSLVKGVGNSKTEFKIKVEVYDSSNAKASQELLIYNVDTPTLSSSAPNGEYLVGDTGTIPIAIRSSKAQNASNGFTNVKLQATIDPSYFQINTTGGWIKEGSSNIYNNPLAQVIFDGNGVPNPEIQTKNLNLIFLKENAIGIPTVVTYTDAFGLQNYPNTIVANVRASTIMTEIKYREQGIDNVRIHIKDSLGNDQTTNGSKTNNGQFIKNNLPTGTYKISMDQVSIDELMTKGYELGNYEIYRRRDGETYTMETSGTITDTPQEVHLDYTKYNYKIVYRFDGNPLKNISYTSYRKNTGTLFYNEIGTGVGSTKSGNINTDFKFTLTRSVTDLVMESKELPSLVGLSYGTPLLYKNGVQTTITGFSAEKVGNKFAIKFVSGLDKGGYTIKIPISYEGTENLSTLYSIDFEKAQVKEAGTDTYDITINTKLDIQFVKYPKLL